MVPYNTLVPVFVLTGFLGSGKTTLLNRLLHHPSLADAAVLINEFGDVGIDHQLVETIDETTVLLDSGCLCCTIRDDLKTSMLELHGKRVRGVVPPYRRMIIETTGLADPSPILYTLLADQTLRHHYRLGTLITTVDAVNGLGQLDRQEESVKQVAVADRIVLTKTDLVADGTLAPLRERLAGLNPSARLMNAVNGDIDAESLLRADLYDPATKGAEVLRWIEAEAARAGAAGATGPGHDVNRHGPDIHTFCIVHEEPIDWTAFGIWLTMLLHSHGEEVLRVKGILNVRGIETPVVINGVQHIVHPPMHLEGWPDDDRRSRIVFIVRGIPRARIVESLAAFNRLAGVAPDRPEAA